MAKKVTKPASKAPMVIMMGKMGAGMPPIGMPPKGMTRKGPMKKGGKK